MPTCFRPERVGKSRLVIEMEGCRSKIVGGRRRMLMVRLSDTDHYADVPFDIATFMWYTVIDPMSGKAVQVARHLRDRKLR